MTAVATYPAEVSALVEALVDGAREALGENFVGFYLRGSLALGGFDPETSDVDVLVVTERPVSEGEFTALDRLHTRVGARENEYGRHYEVSYVDRASLRRFAPGERWHPTVGSDWAFVRAEHRDNFVLERWTTRERGIVVVGPDPKTLIEPISADELRTAVAGELHARIESWAGGAEPPDWLGTRYYQAFEIETLCRALHTLESGELPTKRQAADWALGGFDPETSDVDVVVVTERSVSDAEFVALKTLHERLPPEGNDFSLDYDVYYIDRGTIRRPGEGQRHVKVGTGEPFSWRQNRPNWVLERWTLRERGLTVAGPDAKSLIDPVSPGDLRSTAGAELGARFQQWSDGSWPRRELAHAGVQAFEVETVCRALFTVATGTVSSKRQAVEWALASLPERWQPLIGWSQAHSRDLTRDEGKIPEVLEFLGWAAAKTG